MILNLLFKRVIKNKSEFKRAFTLIELLVVISIIGMLSSVVLASVARARDQALLAKFKQELVQIRNAVELYRLNNNGRFPPELVKSSGYAYGGSDTPAYIEFLAAELNSLGLYGSPTFKYPSTITSWHIKPGLKTVQDITKAYGCGSDQDYQNVEYVYYFQVTDPFFRNQFPLKYEGSTYAGDSSRRCFGFY